LIFAHRRAIVGFPASFSKEMAAMKTIAFDDLPSLAGQEIGASDWVEISQDRINKFADATGDHQWIHVDTERAAKELPTKSTIAHGYLTLSLIPMLTQQILKVTGVTQGINYGSNKVRFTSMVPVGSRVRARQVMKSVTPKAGGLQVVNEVTIEIEGQDRPACVAETISLLFK
jgi:acyl dehydratase